MDLINEIYKLELEAAKALPIARNSYEKIATAVDVVKAKDNIWKDIEYCLHVLVKLSIYKELKILSINGNSINIEKIEKDWDKILDIKLSILFQLCKENK